MYTYIEKDATFLETFSTFEVARIVGITKDQLFDWMHRGFITPDVQASGKGTRNKFTRWEVYGVGLFKVLIDSGLSRAMCQLFYDAWRERTASYDITKRHQIEGIGLCRLLGGPDIDPIIDTETGEVVEEPPYPIRLAGWTDMPTLIIKEGARTRRMGDIHIDGMAKVISEYTYSNIVNMQDVMQRIDENIEC